ncbi:hypothetical protein [Photobacterium leiognathi]|uniref:hypothetical protein n=1 Tax=Photobacterium leiognathi TaxID=553611 RepID=UPI002980C155|nr:hypothetical protein [Photobacterium leiognathi]
MKRKNNRADYLEKYYVEKTNSRINSIIKILNESKKLGLCFKNQTKLSEYIASKLSSIEDSPVWGSTIRRNPKYKTLILEYFHEIDPSKLPLTNDDKLLENSIKLRQLTIELSEANKKIKCLSLQIDEANELLSKRLSLEYNEKLNLSSELREKVTDKHKESYEDLYVFILHLLKDEMITIDFNLEYGYILDQAEDQVIMDKKNFPNFFKWLSDNL